MEGTCLGATRAHCEANREPATATLRVAKNHCSMHWDSDLRKGCLNDLRSAENEKASNGRSPVSLSANDNVYMSKAMRPYTGYRLYYTKS